MPRLLYMYMLTAVIDNWFKKNFKKIPINLIGIKTEQEIYTQDIPLHMPCILCLYSSNGKNTIFFCKFIAKVLQVKVLKEVVAFEYLKILRSLNL